ncbi:XdhC family protein [Luteibacter yeojuensis]|uniref:XdhC family protein n=1 Tax=Luteibacter yeojuensis TaxID=345309 RepID=A0A7X5QWW7_9GAMM|nr:XdhC family protein [Luteibacter yeojuensis]NID16942.1 XdhC family protein [Luteibacter yeojuensis]
MSALDTSTAPVWPAWPDYALAEDLLPLLREFAHRGRVALATLVTVQGPSPRPVGSEMAIAADGTVAGYVSGGCVEAAVAGEAALALAEGRPRLLDYGVGSDVVDIQLSCGGRIGIFVRELREPSAYVHALGAARRERRTVTSLVDAATGDWRIGDGAQAGDDATYAVVHRPPLRLVAVGGDPVTLAVARLAPLVGVDVVLLRPHGPASPPPDTTLAAYDARSLPVALADLVLDDRTAVYSLSHDAEVDHLVAAHALDSPAFAVGVLGSRNKIGARIQRLRDHGVDEDALDRLQLPAGLPIGAQTPHGIALSILAQICQRDRARQA